MEMVIAPEYLDRYAEVLVWGLKTARRDAFRKGDVILIRFDLAAIPLAEIIQAHLMDLGMNPLLRLSPTPTMEHTFYYKANQRQLVFQPSGDQALFQSLNGSIYLHAPESLTHLADIDPKRIGKVAIARKPLRDILDRREEKGRFGWTLCTFPTRELAKQAGLTLQKYAGQVIKACHLDNTHPVTTWKDIHDQASAIKAWLKSMDVNYYHVESERIDLRVTPGAKRRWVGISGHNIPSFEIFTSPDWRGTEGVYYADQPSFRSGNYVASVRLTFEKGKAVRIEAEKGEDFAVKLLSTDRGACRVGEFSLTDRRFSRINRFMANTLYDENFGGKYGNCHLAVGSSYTDTYEGDPSRLGSDLKRKLGFNDSALHWDLVNTERKRVTAHLAGGGRIVLYEDGVFRH
jgi:aminopeptidase